jgi:hypothetical protein
MLWMVGAALATTSSSYATTFGHTMEIATGVTIDRTWTDVVDANYAYGAKQSYDSVTGETHIWMPYGATDGVYFAASNVNFVTPSGGNTGMIASSNGDNSCYLTYKLHFDAPIATFKYSDGYTYFDLRADGADPIVAGFEYSVDGVQWTTLREISSGGSFEPFVNAEVTGLNTSDLYLRYYTRNSVDPSDVSGGTRFMQARTAGAPSWGGSHFFSNQADLIVTTVPEPATCALLAVGGVAMIRRKCR